MKTVLLLVGKTDHRLSAELIDDYRSRIVHYMPFDIVTLPDIKNTRSLSPVQQKQAEGELILRQLEPSDCVVLLDERGRQYTSPDFARWMEKRQAAYRRLVLIIGGPYGFSEAVYSRAAEQISLSLMTFSHQMVRLFLVEQIYRACTILRGEPYHH